MGSVDRYSNVALTRVVGRLPGDFFHIRDRSLITGRWRGATKQKGEKFDPEEKGGGEFQAC